MSVEQCVDSYHGARGKQAKVRQPWVRIPVGVNLILSLTLAGLAVALRSPLLLSGLAVANLIYLGLTRSGWGLLWKAVRILLWQSGLLLLLHYLRFGLDGLLPGLRISAQLFLAFLPGMIFLKATSKSQLARVASRFLPTTAAFVLGASLHFLPLLLAEVKGLYQVQILRGARIHPRDILKPWCWPDWVACLIVPATVQALVLAGDIALAAKVRDFGSCRQRTCWPAAEGSSKLEREL